MRIDLLIDMCRWMRRPQLVVVHGTIAVTELLVDPRWFVDMCRDMCRDKCRDMCRDMCRDKCRDKCRDMCRDICRDMWRHVRRHA